MKSDNTFFQCSLCLWDEASISLVLPGTTDVTGSRRKYKLFTPHLSLRRMASTVFFWEDFLALGDKKPLVFENYPILNKRNVLTDNNLGDLFFVCVCDAVHPGIFWHCKNGCVSGTTQKTQLSLSINHKLRNLLLQLTTITFNTDWTSTWKVMDYPFNVLLSLCSKSEGSLYHVTVVRICHFNWRLHKNGTCPRLFKLEWDCG